MDHPFNYQVESHAAHHSNRSGEIKYRNKLPRQGLGVVDEAEHPDGIIGPEVSLGLRQRGLQSLQPGLQMERALQIV